MCIANLGIGGSAFIKAGEYISHFIEFDSGISVWLGSPLKIP